MSTTKEQRREKEEIKMVTPSSTTTTAFAASPSYGQQREEQHFVNRTSDQTENNIRRITDEARKDISNYTQVVNDCLEETIQAANKIADNYLESQKEIINSLQSAWVPQIEAANRAFALNWSVSPTQLSENYARIVNTLADNTVAANKLLNNAIVANLEGFKLSVQNARNNVKEFSRIGVTAQEPWNKTKDTVRVAGEAL
jgi:hypothetical protein